MGRMKQVTRGEIKAAQERADDLIMDLHELNDRIEKGYCDDIADPAAIARNMNALVGAASKMVTLMMVRIEMNEQRAEMAALLKSKQTQ